MNSKSAMFIVTLAAGCSANAATTTPEPEAPVEKPAVEPPASTEATPAAEKPEAVGQFPCFPLKDGPAIQRWREQMISALNTSDATRAIQTLKCVDPTFSLEFFPQVAEWLVDATPRQLDADREEEWVLQMTQYSPRIGHGEREELVWIAILDKRGETHELAGLVVEPKLSACLIGDKRGLWMEFPGEETASDEAKMIVVQQDVKACGTRVDLTYRKTAYHVEAGKLAATTLEPPDGKSWNRTESAQEK